MKIPEPDHDALQAWLQANIANAVKAERDRWRRVLERLGVPLDQEEESA